MLEDMSDGSQFHPCINRREAHYKIRGCFKQRQVEWKGTLLSMQNMGKFYTRHLRLLLMIFHKNYQFWMNQAQNLLISFQNLETFQK